MPIITWFAEGSYWLERLTGSQEAEGSNPFFSTNKQGASKRIALFSFLTHRTIIELNANFLCVLVRYLHRGCTLFIDEYTDLNSISYGRIGANNLNS